ncbi:hypothetical protein HDU93_004261 [Gonapodya sp. JEL0774]|nr:hypothetical protein HDU93_004261 [Gonapodya sp. JEL0774]
MRHTFIGVTLHYIEDNGNIWTPVIKALDLVKLSGSHSGENLGPALGNILDLFGVTQKLVAVVTDNAANNDTMMRSLRRDFRHSLPNGFDATKNHIFCFAHALNLVANAMISVLRSQIHKVGDNFEAVNELHYAENEADEPDDLSDNAAKLASPFAKV